MRLSDYVAEYIYKDLGIKKIYTLTGGGAMFLNDCIAKHPKLEAVCNHHEQACAMAAVGDAKYNNGFSAAIFTTGCGATNAITGLLDAWQDNVRCFFISGQVKRKQTSHNSNVGLRAFGIQEANIIPVVKSITKYSVMINEPQEIAYHLEKASFLAKIGRPGPIWIDIPADVQGANIDVDNLKHFNSSEYKKNFVEEAKNQSIEYTIKALESAKRPIILAGNGIRLANALNEFRKFNKKSKIPVVASYLAADILKYDNDSYIGVVGIKGDRAANFAIQNSDLILSIGCRLAVGVTGFEYNLFAREAKLIVVDIDKEEHKKNTVKIDSFINADANIFLKQINQFKDISLGIEQWRNKVLNWKRKWSVSVTKYQSDSNNINKYTFIQHLNALLPNNAVVVSDAGSAYYVTSQAININHQQRYITSGAQADMGFTLPATIGVANSADGQVIGITGDGSLQLNIQELQTLVYYQYNIKLFIWNNNGYLSIRATQKKFFAGRLIGTDSSSGISFPDIKKIAYAYGIKYFKIEKVMQLDKKIQQVLLERGPVICEVICPDNQEIIPTVSSIKKNDGTMMSKPLEDMYPFLDREEFSKQMIVKPIKED